MIPLGPFVLESPLARGGMGEVWRGHHVGQRVPVAIKVLTARTARDPRYGAAFRAEARSMAGLSHPGIVEVLDFGEIGPETAAASGGALQAGSPYLVMELCEGGSLAEVEPPRTFERLRDLLQALLAALGHAHAHGVVHRDLKPRNVLLTADGVIKLGDFGIAHPLDTGIDTREQPGPGELAGTPEYMAPEQCYGRPRDFGPWTDLYALGCLGWQLATGRTPFEGPQAFAVLSAHVQSPLPPFVPRLALPPGFEAWLRRLLTRPPQRRFPRAADAAFALAQLEAADETQELALVAPALGEGRTTEAWSSPDTTLEPLGPHLGAPDPALYESQPAVEGTSGTPALRPPWPADWRTATETPRRPDLLGAGLGLYDLRPVPLVGREAVRDRLWAEVAALEAGSPARVFMLRGPAGTGKSRLAEWVCAAAHERGAAVVLRATAAAAQPAGEALSGMLRRHLRVGGLERTDMAARLHRLLSALGEVTPIEIAALLEAALPSSEEDRAAQTGVRFHNAAERHRVVATHLRRLTAERPVVLWGDDLQFGLDVLDFIRFFLSEPAFAALPVLFLLTARDEDLPARPEEQDLLADLLTHPQANAATLTPLPPAEHAALIRSLLVLDVGLARTLAERTAGSPLFAVQLVRDWVRRRLLEVGPLGFQLAPGAGIALPDDLHAVWMQRVDRLLPGHPPAAEPALELAAVLGQAVSPAEWAATCAEARLPAPVPLCDDLLETLLAQRLVHAVEGTSPQLYAFVHSMLRESLERRAAESGMLADLHRAAVRALARLGGPGHAGRIARHALLAGDRALAMEWLVRSARDLSAAGEFLVAAGELGRLGQLLGQAAGPEADAVRIQMLGLHARLSIERGALDEAEHALTTALGLARGLRDTSATAEALLGLAEIAFEHGDLPRLASLAGEARDLLTGVVDPALHGQLWRRFAYLAAAEARYGDAEACYREARRLYREAGQPLDAAKAGMGLAMILKQRGHLDEAMIEVQRARAAYEQLGSRVCLADGFHNQGEIERLLGRLDDAERSYRASLALYRAIGSADTAYAEINLALTLLDRGDTEGAEPLLRRALTAAERQGRRLLAACGYLFLLPCLAARGDAAARDEWQANLDVAITALASTGMHELDLARGFEAAGRSGVELGLLEQAAQAYGCAIAQWEALGHPDAVARCREALAALS